MIYKRYQYYTNNGIQWTSWFKWDSTIKEKYQFKNKLLNEYKDLCDNPSC